MVAYGSDCKINFEGSTNAEFWSITSYFEAPIVSLYSSLIEYENSQSSQHTNYIQYFTYMTQAVRISNDLSFSLILISTTSKQGITLEKLLHIQKNISTHNRYYL